jgi:hypothetical protein
MTFFSFLLANELGEYYLNHGSTEDFVSLRHLQSLRVFAICTHLRYWDGDHWQVDGPPDIWTAFPWLLQVLKAVPILNPLEEIIIKVVHLNSDEFEYIPAGFRDHFPWEKLETLFTEQFPRLRKVKLLLEAHHMPVLREIIDVGHALAVDLLQRGILEIKESDPTGEYHFCPDLPPIIKSLLLAN